MTESSYLNFDKDVKRIRLNEQILEVKPNKDYVEVVFFGDLHYGSPQCDVARAKSMLEYCEKNNVYVFLMGDLLENANRYSVGAGVYEQKINPDEQFDEVVEMLRPLSSKGLVIGNLLGNHEDRTYKDTGVNLTKLVSKFLKVPYLGSACWSTFKVGSQLYRVYTLHGASSSRFVYTKLKAVVDISHSFECDILAMGHVHDCADTSQLVQYVKDGRVLEKKKFIVITGHYLRYDEGYAQAKGMSISKLGSPKVKFFSDRHDIHTSW